MIIIHDDMGDAGYLAFDNEEAARLYEELDSFLSEVSGSYPADAGLQRVDVQLDDIAVIPTELMDRIATALETDEDTGEYKVDEKELWALFEETNEYWYEDYET